VRYDHIGRLEVSVVGVGCNNFGRALDQEGTRLVVDAALEAGITYFDTASNYGNGQSERFLGAALGSRRDEAVVATKFGMPVPGVDGSGGARPDYVRAAAERSLRELGTDRIDLYQLHLPDPDTPIAETLGAMAELVEQGKVIEIGCSNLDAEQTAEAVAASDAGGHPRFASNQIHYSLVHREPEENGLVELAGREGIALLPFYPLASGLLTGKARKGEIPEGRLQMERYQEFLTDENFAVVEGLRAFAAARGVSMATVAIGWLLAQPTVPSVTPGATRPEQIASNVEAAAWQPSAADLAEIERIVAGTGS
jgi:aryl-alcohol dehydrogenase-like predicted oxidoreductase